MRSYLLLLIGLTVFAAGVVHAQPTFVARVDRTEVGLGDSFTLEITLSVENGQVDNYRAPDLRGFRVLSERPSQSTQVQMGGGRTFMRQVYGWHYEVLTLTKGNFTVGPAKVRVDGKEWHTEKIAITVVDTLGAVLSYDVTCLGGSPQTLDAAHPQALFAGLAEVLDSLIAFDEAGPDARQ